MEWGDEAIARLRELWAEGLSTAEIGRRMGVSKNAVVGKAHRLNLQARPSPIRREAAVGALSRAPLPRRAVGPTLPPLSPAPAPQAEASSARPVSRRDIPPPAPPARPAILRPVGHRPLRSASCCWPIGEPGTKSFRFCDADAAAGKPYCGEHAQLAYVKVRDRREEAA